MLAACGQAEKNTNSAGQTLKEKVFYVETKNFGIDLQSCFSHNLFNKWSDTSYRLSDNTISFNGKDIENKHTFLDIKSFTQTNPPERVEKVSVILKGDLTIKNTTYSISRFALQANGQWTLIENYGDFKTFDRTNDFISPANLDVDEICEQLVQKTVECSYKQSTTR